MASVASIRSLGGNRTTMVSAEYLTIARPITSATQGVIVMRFKEEGDHVISLALTDHEEDSAEAEE